MSGEGVDSSRVRRMLPSVSDVLKELTARAPIEPDIAFRAAREVCAEELKRIRDAGGESVPLEDLVQRAFLRATGGAPPPTQVPVPPPPPPPEPVPVPETEPWAPAPQVESGVEDPFSETTGAMDLRWDRENREPFSEPRGAGPLADVEPLPGVLPTAGGPDQPLGVPEPLPPPVTRGPILFDTPAEEDVFVAAPPEPEPTAILAPEPAEAGGPGEETLNRLSREAESIDLRSVFPSEPGPSRVPYAVAAEGAAGTSRRGLPTESPAPFEDDEDTVLTIPRGGRPRRGGGVPRVSLAVGLALGLLALAGLGYLLVGLWVERDATPPPVAVARPRRVAPPSPVPTAPAASTAPEATVSPIPAATTSPAAARSTAPAAVPTTVPTAVAARTPAAVAATAPAPVATKAPRVAPTPVAPSAPEPSPVSSAPATARVALSRDGLVVTKDRAGQAQVYSIHFTSYRDRASAERDLKRVQALAGREGYVAEVDLGEKGVWQRVMIGTFPTAQDAKAVREELAAKGTRDLGLVYRVVGPEGADRR